MFAFRAHRNGIDQTGFAIGAYSQVLTPCVSVDPAYKAAGYNEGGRFDVADSSFTPVAVGELAAPVSFDGQLWITEVGSFLGSGRYFVARVCKNGPPSVGISVGSAKIATKGAFTAAICGTEDWIIDLSMHDIAQPGDVYRLYLDDAFGPAILNGNSLHSSWSGMKHN